MGRLAFFCALLLLLAAPWLRGGNRQVALALLVTLSLLFFAAVLGSWSFARAAGRFGLARVQGRPQPEPGARSTPAVMSAAGRQAMFWPLMVLLLSSPLWVAVLQLYPLAAATWAGLPGRGAYLPGLAAVGGAPVAALPLSLNPSGTVASLWAGVPLAAALLAGVLANVRQAWLLFGAMVVVVVLQVLVTLVQYVQGPSSLLYFDSQFVGYRMIGTFNNRNHLADLFAMVIPVWFALLGRWRRDTEEPRAKVALFVVPLWYLLGFAVLVLLLATQSRGGLVAALVALSLSVILHVQASEARMLWRHWLAMGMFLLLFALIAFMAVGEDRVTERFAQTVLRADAETRNLLARSTFDAALAFWPWGSGAGSFEPVFPRFQSALSPGYTGFAHNDYAQLLMEFGAVAVLLAGVLLALVLVQVWRLGAAARRHRGLDAAMRQQWFAGVGALAMLLHSWVEFNMHIPAITITAAMLLGLFLRPVEGPQRRG
jgi:O-Antigen ligase